MCGFLGQYNFPNLPKGEFLELLALAKHRGPDQTGYWESENIQLGFNRLSILDVSEAGHQPMVSPSGKYTLVFNGEVYNFKEIKSKLPEYNYRGHSDTEIITHALDVWGIDKTVESLDGMFAMAVYHSQENKLYLIRDFAGIKPLFYGFENGKLVFGSQYDQIRAHTLFKDKAINPQVLKLYFKQHFMPAPFGLHNNLHQVRPGEIISFSPTGEIQKRRYWEIPKKLEKDLITDSEEAQKHFSKAFESSVKDQLVADVPVGAFLSGGVDSPLVCAYAKKYKSGIEVFSIGSDSKTHDESERAKQFAEALDLKQHLWKLDAKEMLAYWDEATAALHEPLADFSILPTYLVAKLAKKQVTVALSGDGGDELFFGYERFWSVGKNIHFHSLPSVARKAIYGFNKYVSKTKSVNSLLTFSRQGKAHESLHSRFSNEWISKIAPDLASIALPDEWEVYDYPNTKDTRQLLANMRYSEFYGMMQKTLRKVDLASMQNSLEVRVPFLQKKTIEAALKIDPLLSYGGGKKKEVLKRNMSFEIPEMQDDGIKRGFSIPLSGWIRNGLEETFEESISSLSKQHSFLNKNAMLQLLEIHKKGERDFKWPLFTLYSLSK